MKSGQPDHSVFRELLYLEVEGVLSAGEKSRLREHLDRCHECRQEREELKSLDRLIGRSKIPVRPDFALQVMRGLPAAGWEARSPRSWTVALVVVALLGLGSAAVISTGSVEVWTTLPAAALAAVWEMFRASALAGAGLLAASWRGLGVGLQEVLGRSVLNMIAFGVLVLCLDLLFLRYVLRNRRKARARAEDVAKPEQL